MPITRRPNSWNDRRTLPLYVPLMDASQRMCLRDRCYYRATTGEQKAYDCKILFFHSGLYRTFSYQIYLTQCFDKEKRQQY